MSIHSVYNFEKSVMQDFALKPIIDEKLQKRAKENKKIDNILQKLKKVKIRSKKTVFLRGAVIKKGDWVRLLNDENAKVLSIDNKSKNLKIEIEIFKAKSSSIMIIDPSQIKFAVVESLEIGVVDNALEKSRIYIPQFPDMFDLL